MAVYKRGKVYWYSFIFAAGGFKTGEEALRKLSPSLLKSSGAGN